jgi:hypothetical protein
MQQTQQMQLMRQFNRQSAMAVQAAVIQVLAEDPVEVKN